MVPFGSGLRFAASCTYHTIYYLKTSECCYLQNRAGLTLLKKNSIRKFAEIP
ncbi:hypothetical protein PM8797T_14646 [Gimesia maris DSM 8797]|nr:hypothetical protein PM8797T_14646 [Gimesia maris DSM 8797]